MSWHQFWSRDSRYGCRLSDAAVTRIAKLVADTGNVETGGILIGKYTAAHDCAVVTEALNAPVDSKHSRVRFMRGIAGLQRKLDALWRARSGYYLGEWHSHPRGSLEPSSLDIEQMTGIASSDRYKCPEPLLLIAQIADCGVLEMRVFVFSAHQAPIELYQTLSHR